MNWTKFRAALFDLDGVLTPTAEIHMRAWNEMFSAFLACNGISQPYTNEDYFSFVDGKARYDGVRDFLASRGIKLPEGTPTDGPGAETICGLGNRKNAVFGAILSRDGIAPYPGTIPLLDLLDSDGVRVGVVSSSRNARSVLQAAGLLARFPVIVDGVTAEREGLPGKPDPAMFLRAAALLEADPSSVVVIEDAVAGVAAGSAGSFGAVVGVDRGAGAAQLRAAGASQIITSLEELL